MRRVACSTAVAAVTMLACCLRVVASAENGDTNERLAKLLNVRIIDNETDGLVPAYMYDLYDDRVNERYDVIRSIWPTIETFGSRTQLVYDIDGLEPIETVEKVVLHMDSPEPGNQIDEAIQVSFYSSSRHSEQKMYLGSTIIRNTLDLTDILGSNSITDFGQLVVHSKNSINLLMGLVLYSTTTEANRRKRSHDLATLMYKTKTERRGKRSLTNNEIDEYQIEYLPDTHREIKKKNKKKKNKTHKAHIEHKAHKAHRKHKAHKTSHLRAVDNGDTIVFTSKRQCRLQKLELKFKDIGWENWVIFPEGFETNFCTGGCAFPLDMESKPTNHATVQSLARSYGRMANVPEPGCVPAKLAPVSLLFMDRSDHVILKSYPNMRVVTCACN